MRQRLKDLEESLVEQREFDEQRFHARLNEMEKSLNAYKSMESEKEQERRKLEYELTIAARTAQMAEVEAREKEARISAKCVTLQNQLNEMIQEKNAHGSNAENAEKQMKRLSEMNQYMTMERETMENALNEAQRVIAGLQNALRVANSDAALVPQYQVLFVCSVTMIKLYLISYINIYIIFR